jgi:hypothetical protein
MMWKPGLETRPRGLDALLGFPPCLDIHRRMIDGIFRRSDQGFGIDTAQRHAVRRLGDRAEMVHGS